MVHPCGSLVLSLIASPPQSWLHVDTPAQLRHFTNARVLFAPATAHRDSWSPTRSLCRLGPPRMLNPSLYTSDTSTRRTRQENTATPDKAKEHIKAAFGSEASSSEELAGEPSGTEHTLPAPGCPEVGKRWLCTSQRHLGHQDSSVPWYHYVWLSQHWDSPAWPAPGRRGLIPQPLRGSRAVHPPPLLIPALSNAARLRQRHFSLSFSLGLEAAWLRL